VLNKSLFLVAFLNGRYCYFLLLPAVVGFWFHEHSEAPSIWETTCTMILTLTHDQARTLAIVERSASVLSTIGVLAIICTFCYSKHFRNPVHRLIFINAFYNLFDIAATFISVSGPDAGNHSSLCQFQGFLMQM
jgi:hypothetical protein